MREEPVHGVHFIFNSAVHTNNLLLNLKSRPNTEEREQKGGKGLSGIKVTGPEGIWDRVSGVSE